MSTELPCRDRRHYARAAASPPPPTKRLLSSATSGILGDMVLAAAKGKPPHVAMYDVPKVPGVEGITETATRLMEAAADAFADRGFHATTTRDIARRAGLSPAGVYVHFASKEALLYALCEGGHLAARDMVAHAATAADSPTEALLAIVSNFARWHAEQYRIARIVQYEFGHLTDAHGDRVLALRKEIDAIMRGVLTDGTATGEFAIDEVADTSRALLSLCIDVARWYQPSHRHTPKEIGASTARLGLRLVVARP